MREPPVIADLTVIAGPMFAGKTTALIERVRAIAGLGVGAFVIIKPAMDTRYAHDAIVSHDGVSWTATPVANAKRVREIVTRAAMNAGEPVHVFCDEVQFLDAPRFCGRFHEVVHTLVCEEHPVTCAGLDLDYRGLPFDVTARLLAMADDVVKLKARCVVTGAAAAKTYKKRASGERVELGSGDIYEPRCNGAWRVEGVEREAVARGAERRRTAR
jgi:thymidine kinase